MQLLPALLIKVLRQVEDLGIDGLRDPNAPIRSGAEENPAHLSGHALRQKAGPVGGQLLPSAAGEGDAVETVVLRVLAIALSPDNPCQIDEFPGDAAALNGTP